MVTDATQRGFTQFTRVPEGGPPILEYGDMLKPLKNGGHKPMPFDNLGLTLPTSRNNVTSNPLSGTSLGSIDDAQAKVAVEWGFEALALAASGPAGGEFTQALDGLTGTERMASGSTDAMSTLRSELADYVHPDQESNMPTPNVKVVGNGNLESANGVEDLLPEGVNGAFVPDGNGSGTILLSETLFNGDVEGAPSLGDVVIEEVGEAVAHFAESQGVDIAEGDVGNRLLKVAKGELLTESDFVSDPTTDTTHVLLDGEIVVANADETPGLDIELVALSNLQIGVFSAYFNEHTTALNPDQISFLTSQGLIDSAAAGEDPPRIVFVEENWTGTIIRDMVANLVDDPNLGAATGGGWASALKSELGMTRYDVAQLTADWLKTDDFDSADILAIPASAFDARTSLIDGNITFNVLHGPRYAEVGLADNAVTLEESNWADSAENLDSIAGSGADWGAITDEFSPVLDLDQDWVPGTKVVMSHRGNFNNGSQAPENSLASIQNSLKPSDTSMNSIEIDVISTSDGKIVMSHDFTPTRVTTLNDDGTITPFSDLSSEEVLGEPIIIRDIDEYGEYTGNYVPTNQVITSMETSMRFGLDLNPDAVFYLDARNDDPGRVMLELAEHPNLASQAVVKAYAYDDEIAADGGDAIKQDIQDAIDATGSDLSVDDVLGAVKINPVITTDLIDKIAEGQGYGELDDSGNVITTATEKEKIQAVKNYINTFIDGGFDIGSLQPDVFGIGQYFRGAADDSIGEIVSEPIDSDLGLETLTQDLSYANSQEDTLRMYQNDSVNMNIVDWLRFEHPTIPVMQYYRMDDFTTKDGLNYVLNVWKGDIDLVPDNLNHLRDEFKSTPGTKVIQEYGDIFLTDRPYAEMGDLHNPDYLEEYRVASGKLKSAV